MTTPSESRSVKALKKEVASQNQLIGKLRQRMGTLVDDVTVMEKDIARFKEQVSSDIKMLIERMNK